MNILFVHEVSYLDKPVYEYQDFPERLAHMGHDVTVIDFVENRKTDGSRRRVSRTGLAEVTLCSIAHANVPVLKYFQAQYVYCKMLKKLLDEKKTDVIVLYSVFVNGMSTVILARNRGVPVVFRAIDIYHKLRSQSLIQSLLRFGEGFIYRRADRILATNEKMLEYVLTYLADGYPEGKLKVLDHGVDTEHFFREVVDAGLRNRLNLSEDDEVAVFLGTTYSFARLSEFVALLPEYLRRRPRFRLLIVGAGESDEMIREEIGKHGLNDVVLPVGMIDYQHLPAYLSVAVLAINTFSINDITRDIVPIKILQYLAAGLPVVSTPLPDVCKKLPAAESGVFYSKTDDLRDVLQLVDELLSDRGRLEKASLQAASYAIHHLSINKTVDRIMENFRELAGEKHVS